MLYKRIIAGLSALLLGIQVIPTSVVSAVDTNNLKEISLKVEEIGSTTDVKVQVETGGGYKDVYNYNDLSTNLVGGKSLYVPYDTTKITFIDCQYTEAKNDDSVICVVDGLDAYTSIREKYKINGMYKPYELIYNPSTDTEISNIVLKTYVEGDMNLSGEFLSNDMLLLKQQLIFGYNVIQTGAYMDEEDNTGGNLSIKGRDNNYCNVITLNGDIYAENNLTLKFINECFNGNLLSNNINLDARDGVTFSSAPFDFNKDMLLSEDDVNEIYFSNALQTESTTEINEQNLNINENRAFADEITFNAKSGMTLNASIKADGDININGEVHNGNNSVIYSKENITIQNNSTFSYTGLIYAPNGIVHITAQNVNITGCIIAKEVIIEADTVNFNVNNYVISNNNDMVLTDLQLFIADMNYDGVVDDKDLDIMKRIILGLDRDSTYIPYEEWSTLEDSDGDGIPDIFAFDNWINLNDWDEDGIPDSVESYYNTNRYIKDTDNDNLTDYEELFYTYTDPLVFDSLIESVSDGEIDLDEDGLTNAQEMEYTRIYSTNLPENNTYTRLNPLNSDSDEDGLSDYYEIFKSGTNPLISDTDGNGILDGDEKFEQTYTKNTDNDVITGISIIGDFSKDINETTSIRSIMDEDMMCANVVGLVGEPFDIETTSDFDNATITFSVDSTKLDGKSLDDLLLLWYDEENDNFVELNTQVNAENNTISLTTTHFSKYMLVDKQEWFDCWKNAPNYFKSDLYTPYNTSICIDCSGSMENNDAPFYYAEKYPNLWTSMPQYEQTTYRKLAVERYIWAMQYNDSDNDNKNDKTSIIHYTNSIKDDEKCGLTSSKTSLINILKPYNSGGNDARLAVNEAITDLSELEDGHNRMIILLCDGDINIDTSDNDADRIIANCITNNIKIYTIGLGSGANSSVLESLAEKTNGEFFTATTADELSKIYHNIRVEQYQSIDWADNDGDNIPDYFETQGMMCSNGQMFLTNPNNPDSDGDGLLDGEEIVVTYGQKYIEGAGNEGHSISAVYFTYKSNPRDVDSDADGIHDFEDTAPNQKGILNDDDNIVIGKLTLISCADGFNDTGHSFYLYQSYIKDKIDLSNFKVGFEIDKTNLTANRVTPTVYNLDIDEVISIGNGGYEDETGQYYGISYNMEFIKYIYFGYEYIPNTYVSKDITNNDMKDIISYCQDDSVNNWTILHNCSTVACEIWNMLFDEKVSSKTVGEHIDTPEALKNSISKLNNSSNNIKISDYIEYTNKE